MATSSIPSMPFDLSAITGFPLEKFNENLAQYAYLGTWWTGSVLDETVETSDGGKVIERFPIKINPLQSTAEKHTALLFGKGTEQIQSDGVPFRFITRVKDDSQKELAQQVEDALADFLEKQDAASLITDNAIKSQWMGGCWFQLTWNADSSEIELHAPDPSECIQITEGDRNWRYRKVWLARQISSDEALFYGYKAEGDTICWYVEEWDSKTYRISINGKVINLNGFPAEGINPFNEIGFVYIPHLRFETRTLGKSMITSAVEGIVRELNIRFSDLGDAVGEDSHGVLAARNVRGALKVLTLADGRQILDLGNSSGLGNNDQQPDLFSVKTNSATEPQRKFVKEDLWSLYRREVDHPAVADGEDEGSQRSSLTLTTRMWPITAHVDLERSQWTTGLKKLGNIALRMMATKGLYGITEKHLEIPLGIKWEPMLAKDRETLINEIGIRAANDIGSKQHLMEMTGDIANPEEEMQRIEEEKKVENENVMKLQEARMSQSASNKQNNPGKTDNRLR